MPPKKGLGGAKGKGKAPRTQAKRVRHRDDSPDEELDPQVAALIAKVQALERSRGVAVSAPAVNPQTTGVRQRHTRRQTQADLLQSLAARIEAIEPQRPQLTEQSPLPDQAGTCGINEDVPSGPQTQTASDGIQPAAPIPTAPNAAGWVLSRPGTLGASAAGTHDPIPMGHWQLEIERAVWQSIAPSTRTSYQRADRRRRCAPVRIVICGHSMVFWAGRRAANSSIGTQLGFSQLANIQWLGRRGMRWERLLPTLFQAAASPPQVLIIHLGGNDLGFLKGKALILQAIADFKVIRQRWPGIVITWSCILPRFAWRSSEIKPLERARRRVNGEIFRDLIKHGDVSIRHPLITLARRELYRQDGVHLSDIGNDLILHDLQRGLKGVLGRWGGSD
ncbi:uncharacterized protein LOC134398982 isoform X1 [Elgaria multicarinata webbii]|uniref:uncharacterized protein LOC134398982 isoform X1 n=1 Tax=Elgaria multicarinata webbii TaxID=159646 RepID=UPI002FCD5DAD